MMVRSAGASPAQRRHVGVRAGLSLPRIIEAARLLDPDALTMQAVADALGVDRKALNHHVSDRETLLALVAVDTFTTEFSAVQIGVGDTWQQACRTYAHAFVDCTFALGSLADQFRVRDTYVTNVLGPTEAVLAKMVAAGFDDEAAMRSLSLLTNICLAYARDRILAASSGVSPRSVILRSALEHVTTAEFETLTRIAELPVTTYDQKQIELSIDTFIAGTEALLGEALDAD